jgi:HD-GYP domain-containing protein (c-di-GMP phosphodiesterase class II)
VANEIPIESSIVSCCDAFDAMTTDRSYRAAMPLERALAELEAGAGTQFNPSVAAVVAKVAAQQLAAPTVEAVPAALPLPLPRPLDSGSPA